MYAVIQSGGKQHRVKEGEVLRLEKIEVETGESYAFDKVLMVADGDNIKIGAPYVEGAAVSAEIISHGRGKKVNIIKFKRRKHHMKRQGHRQWYTEVKITSIEESAKKKAAPKKAAAKSAAKKTEAAKPVEKKPTAKKAAAKPAEKKPAAKKAAAKPAAKKAATKPAEKKTAAKKPAAKKPAAKKAADKE